jgi:hypothetical protein
MSASGSRPDELTAIPQRGAKAAARPAILRCGASTVLLPMCARSLSHQPGSSMTRSRSVHNRNDRGAERQRRSEALLDGGLNVSRFSRATWCRCSLARRLSYEFWRLARTRVPEVRCPQRSVATSSAAPRGWDPRLRAARRPCSVHFTPPGEPAHGQARRQADQSSVPIRPTTSACRWTDRSSRTTSSRAFDHVQHGHRSSSRWPRFQRD